MVWIIWLFGLHLISIWFSIALFMRQSRATQVRCSARAMFGRCSGEQPGERCNQRVLITLALFGGPFSNSDGRTQTVGSGVQSLGSFYTHDHPLWIRIARVSCKVQHCRVKLLVNASECNCLHLKRITRNRKLAEITRWRSEREKSDGGFHHGRKVSHAAAQRFDDSLHRIVQSWKSFFIVRSTRWTRAAWHRKPVHIIRPGTQLPNTHRSDF